MFGCGGSLGLLGPTWENCAFVVLFYVFKKKAQFASSLWKQNRPSDKSAKGTEAYLAVMKAYKAQHKIGNPYSFMRSLVTDDLKVLLAGNDITGGVKPGGSTTEGGCGGQKPGGEVDA